MDLAARKRHVLPIAGGPLSWSLRAVEAAPLVAFRSELELVDGLIRVRSGNNRPLGEAS